MKTKISVTIDPYILEEAKKKNINISEVTERAVVNKINPANIEIKDIEKPEYPFEICTETLPDHLKKVLFGMCAIKCKRCQKCGKVYFVNDLANEFTICKNCYNN